MDHPSLLSHLLVATQHIAYLDARLLRHVCHQPICRSYIHVCSLICRPKGAITSKIKHAIKRTINHKTSPARLAQLLQPSLAFCFSLQPMTAYRLVLTVIRAATVVQELCKSCRTCFIFYCMFYFTCDRPLIYNIFGNATNLTRNSAIA